MGEDSVRLIIAKGNSSSSSSSGKSVSMQLTLTMTELCIVQTNKDSSRSRLVRLTMIVSHKPFLTRRLVEFIVSLPAGLVERVESDSQRR